LETLCNDRVRILKFTAVKDNPELRNGHRRTVRMVNVSTSRV
jgi:hypothetical protein